MAQRTPISVVTGGNSGIGRATAIGLASRGHTVYATVRSAERASKLQQMADELGVKVHLIVLDVADDTSVKAGFAQILDEAGQIDVLVNNAGVGGNGVVEEVSIDRYAEIMNVNVYGPIRCLKAVLPGMRQRRSGAIVNIGSVVGLFGAPAQAPYVASKWALEGLTEELALEVAAFGIRVALIEPGVTKTAIFAKNADSTDAGSDYEPHLRRMFHFYTVGREHATDATEVADLVYHAISTASPALRYPVSWCGPEIAERRPHISDETWTNLGTIADDDDYYVAFRDALGVDITR